MNLKKVKALRKLAKNMVSGGMITAATQYLQKQVQKTILVNGKPETLTRTTLKLSPSCQRGAYQQMKRSNLI